MTAPKTSASPKTGRGTGLRERAAGTKAKAKKVIRREPQSPPEPARRHAGAFQPDRLKAVGIAGLIGLYEAANAACEIFSHECNTPRMGSENEGSLLLDDECDRLGRLQDAVIAELTARQPADEWESVVRNRTLAEYALRGGEWTELLQVSAELVAHSARVAAALSRRQA